MEHVVQQQISIILLLASQSMSHITQSQNLDRSIDLLCAQRQCYSMSKRMFYSRMFATLGIAVLGPTLLLLMPEIAVQLSLFAIIYLIVDLFWIRRIEERLRVNGAKIQELFDTEVFKLPWNAVACGAKPDREFVSEWKSKFDANQGDVASLVDWYPSEVSKLEHNAARLVCQRTNLWWDVDLRRKLFWWLIAAVITLLFILVFLFNSQVSILTAAIFVMLPFFEFTTVYATGQHSTIKRSAELKSLVEDCMDKRDFGDESSRRIQDAMFQHRSSAPFVPDFFYALFKDDQESQMNYSAEHYVSMLQK